MSNDLTSLPGLAARPAASLPPAKAAPVHAGPVMVAAQPGAAPDRSLDLREIQRNVEEAVSMLNEQMASTGRNLAFSVDPVVDRTVVTVWNKQTGEVVRQIPNEALLRVAHNIESMKGVLLNDLA